MKIGIIGAGNIGGAIAEGLLNSKKVAAQELLLSDLNTALLERFSKLGANVFTDNYELVRQANLVIVAVKPHFVQQVLHKIRDVLTDKTILVSVAAGVTLDTIVGECGKTLPVFRVIPNTAIAVRESMSFITSVYASDENKKTVEDLFNSVGKTLFIDEGQMAAATALSSCGIAFAMRYISANMRAGVEVGFVPNTAKEIMLQTLQGAVSLLQTTGAHPEAEIDRVTTPKGFTIKGLNELEHNGFSSAVIEAVKVSL